jgi:Arc/MetJ-type ribon-helix-helix transcriptional regulator
VQSGLTMFTCQMPVSLRRDITEARKRHKFRNDSAWAREAMEKAAKRVGL